MSAEIQAWFQEYQQKLRDEGERQMLLRLLRSRFGDLPSATVARIEAAEKPQLERWAERLLRAQTLADMLDDPS